MRTTTPSSSPARRRLTALALAGSVALLAACGSDGDDASPDTEAPADTEAPSDTEAPADTASGDTTPADTTPTDTATSDTADDDGTTGDGEAIDNCGVEVPAGDPQAIVTMNQGATEIALSLGFADQMIGTAYLDDAILPDLQADYDAIPVISAEYPSQEALLDLEPDFVYASYPSAFGEDVAGDREGLADLGIGSYLSPGACPDFRESGEPTTFDIVFQEFTEVATVFGDPAAGEALVAEQQAILDATAETDFSDVSVFWWDGGLDAPSAGVCCGAPGMIMDAVGAENAFGDVEGSWGEVSWEAVIDADPDVIVLIDASWDPAADKQAHLENDPALSALTAVQEGNYITVPFSASTPGVRNAPLVGQIGAELQGLGFGG